MSPFDIVYLNTEHSNQSVLVKKIKMGKFKGVMVVDKSDCF